MRNELRIFARKLQSIGVILGIDFYRLVKNTGNISRFVHDLREYRRGDITNLPLHLQPILSDFEESAGITNGHYFHQDLWVARKIFQARPSSHVDIGSRIDGFVAHVLTFMPISVIDIRPLSSTVDGLTFIQADATDLANIANESIESLSCLHAVEHFGLGRYGDPIDSDACFRAMMAMSRVLRPGGHLYLSLPIGIERVDFNAHRVLSPQRILEIFGDMKLASFAAVDDQGNLQLETSPMDYQTARFSCGIFEFCKK